jgi:hypothetical protein
MNEVQKKYVIKSLVGYSVALMMFAALYLLKDPMPAILAIIMFVILLGGKEYRYNRGMSKRAMEEFIEYAKQHMVLFSGVALYTTALPILLFVLSKKNYINAETDMKSLVKFSMLIIVPFVLFDIAHRVFIYNKYERHTEQSNQGDGE